MIFQKNTVFHMFFYQSLASGALVLVITVIADKKNHGIVLPMLYITFLITYFLMPIILKYIDI